MVRVVSSVFAPVDLNNVCAGMLPTLNLGNNSSPRNIFPMTDIIVLITTTRTVISSFDQGHFAYPLYSQRDVVVLLPGILERLVAQHL
jgi:hypothetical protein